MQLYDSNTAYELESFLLKENKRRSREGSMIGGRGSGLDSSYELDD
jgi:hypothetical protein